MHITSVARLRINTLYCTNRLEWTEQKNTQQKKINNLTPLMRITPAATCHIFRDKTYLQTGITCPQWLPHFSPSYTIHVDAFKQIYIYSLQNFSDILLILLPLEFYRNFTTTTMETTEYWPMAWEYTIWNTAIASLQFWAEDLDPITLGIASECVYTTFFWTPTSHTLCQLSEDVLFGCFVIALNAAFTQQLSLADEGYESSSDTVDLPTPLRKTPHIHHVSSMEHASFNPAHTTLTITPCSSPQIPTRPVCHCLSFTSGSPDDDQDPDSTQVYLDSPDEEEDFPTVPLDNEHWTSEIVPERTFCIHNNGLPNNVCQHPCPYGSNDTVSYMDSLDLSDISDYEDYMVTSSDEELPGMEEVPYWHLNSGLLEHLLKILILNVNKSCI